MICIFACCCCSITKSCPTLWDLMNGSTPGLPVLHYPWVCSDSCPLSQWCHPTIPFSSCPQSLPALGTFPKSQLFASGGQSNVDLASVLPMNIQGWISLGLSGLISLQSKGFSWVHSSTTILPHTLIYFFFSLSILHVCLCWRHTYSLWYLYCKCWTYLWLEKWSSENNVQDLV